eukprot:TRINITY_DN121104_c0_g1_i1.p1 TRINITY_DN121104_c0_g1~~TRINITY_DN121104_c0_g1_i1.p1  ORF type:complete len:198 (-),score=17.05 TRINITY_DN121104_c0_g1_i1:118-711(-)
MPSIGRPVPSNLAIEVFEKFKENDHKYMALKKEQFPELVKPPPRVGASGTLGVNWIGLNPDPCKAKYQAKMRGSSTKSLPGQGRPQQRQLDKQSCNAHYLEQRLKLPESLQEESDPLRRTCVFRGKTEELIYHGVSHDERGRKAYLHARKKVMPQERLNHPPTANAEVGWHCYAGKGRLIGRQLAPIPPRPSTIVIG